MMVMKPVTAEILTIGDEILYGQILDTNAQWMSEKLDEIGVRVVRKTTVGDNEKDILDSFEEAESRADITLITGGLGPTKDDLTKPLLSKYFDSPLVMNNEALREISLLFRKKGREMTSLNRKQAELPDKCEKISNPFGTAPGMWFSRNKKVFVSMPGVPFEMKAIMETTVLPKIGSEFRLPVIFHRIIKTVGIGESWLADLIGDWEDELPEHIKLAYLPSKGQVRLRLTAFGDDLNQLKEEVSQCERDLQHLAGEYVYGFDQDTLSGVIGKLLREKGLQVSTAESCTGGKIASMITSVPGSSDYFSGSIIAYSNNIKTKELSVPEVIIKEHGAVSEEVVTTMARKAREKLGTDCSIASSGIAGPGGGTDQKPVGTIWIAVSTPSETVAKKLQLTNKRELNIELTAVASLNLLRQTLIKT